MLLGCSREPVGSNTSSVDIATRGADVFYLSAERIKAADERHTAFITNFLESEELKTFMEDFVNSEKKELQEEDLQFFVEYAASYYDNPDSLCMEILNGTAKSCFYFDSNNKEYVLKSIDDYILSCEDALLSAGLEEIKLFCDEFKQLQQDWLSDLEHSGDYELAGAIIEGGTQGGAGGVGGVIGAAIGSRLGDMCSSIASAGLYIGEKAYDARHPKGK